jgi:hypothetical protein
MLHFPPPPTHITPSSVGFALRVSYATSGSSTVLQAEIMAM